MINFFLLHLAHWRGTYKQHPKFFRALGFFLRAADSVLTASIGFVFSAIIMTSPETAAQLRSVAPNGILFFWGAAWCAVVIMQAIWDLLRSEDD